VTHWNASRTRSQNYGESCPLARFVRNGPKARFAELWRNKHSATPEITDRVPGDPFLARQRDRDVDIGHDGSL